MTIPFPIAQVNARPVGLAELAASAVARAPAPDRHDSFPVEAMAALRGAGLLAAPLPEALGGAGLCTPAGTERLRDVLRGIGRGNLAVGRIYEGHVNALALVLRYGSDPVRARLAADARAGHLFGVWNTEPAEPGGLAIGPEADPVLTGAKSYASGAGYVTRPLVTARLPDGRRQMLVVPLDPESRADLSGWRAHGMRASATGTVDFTGLQVDPLDRVGAPDDYYRQPFFAAGAWRFLAVQCGGIEAVLEAHRGHLAATGRGADPHQRARLGQAATAAETARLFVERAGHMATAEPVSGDRAVAYVALARGAVERAGLDAIELAQRSVGLSGFLEAHPLERLARDLATYLRQPAPDGALAGAATYVAESEAPVHALWHDSEPA
ncbi:acyl-CoA dehydrogenase [Methylobacterium sp. WL12]|uniref:acyl-CoA dehydrogenase family protein n=1 Tax=Methylobacterium sp. WL12 TaxID=2603890 RepID=UPI0011CA5673|nr:acyl-CoA dehydrogenase family protein [Methylobacterium sp. WL12]TXM73073.1 acyl-CoA dehydrogenase [Methylobacterium sp. WL12]